MNRFYNIYNQDYTQQHKYQQTKQILETTHKFHDLLNSINQIDPNYQKLLIMTLYCMLIDYAMGHNNI